MQTTTLAQPAAEPDIAAALDRLGAAITEIKREHAELRAALSELLDVYLNEQGYLPEVEERARAALANSEGR